ncbi:MAG: DUF3568 family protein [Planctomycetota bacterium]
MTTMSRSVRRPRPSGTVLGVLVAAACLVATPSCAALAVGAGVGYAVGQEATEAGMRRGEVRRDVMEVWYTAKEVMGILSSVPIQVNESIPRTILGKVEGAKVEVRVLAWDLGRTRIEVRAREFGFPDEEVAERVLATIVDRSGADVVEQP